MRSLSSFFSYGRDLGLFCVVNGPSVACGARSVATALALLFSVEGNMVLFVGKGVAVVVVWSANVKKKGSFLWPFILFYFVFWSRRTHPQSPNGRFLDTCLSAACNTRSPDITTVLRQEWRWGAL